MYSTDLEEKIQRGFVLARRRAIFRRLFGRLVANLGGDRVCCEALSCFGAARDGSCAVLHGRKEFETVEVARISGSVGRCLDFDHAFLPVVRSLEERWKKVDRAFVEGRLLPPVELYKLGEEYFVLDGNHRVSVARFRGVYAIDALVTEFVVSCGCRSKTSTWN